MKCGFFKLEEFTNPYRTKYSCKWFGFSANSEMILCQDCTINDDGIPYIDGWFEEDETDI